MLIAQIVPKNKKQYIIPAFTPFQAKNMLPINAKTKLKNRSKSKSLRFIFVENTLLGFAIFCHPKYLNIVTMKSIAINATINENIIHIIVKKYFLFTILSLTGLYIAHNVNSKHIRKTRPKLKN
jgi:hypothetical protein